MSNQQDQNDEIEVLMSIFPDEFESISNDPPISFKLLLRPNSGTNECHGKKNKINAHKYFLLLLKIIF